MPWELKESIEFALGTRATPKFKVYDADENDIEISSATFELIKVTLGAKTHDTGTVVLQGSCAVNNDDEDVNGNEFASVTPTLDLNDTDVDEGDHFLWIHVTLSDGASDDMRAHVYVRNYRREP